MEESLAYTWLLRSLRCAWLSCAAAVAAMLPALVLRSAACVTLFRFGLLLCAAAALAAVLLFLLLLARGNRYSATRLLPASKRADTLVANLLADLLDPV